MNIRKRFFRIGLLSLVLTGMCLVTNTYAQEDRHSAFLSAVSHIDVPARINPVEPGTHSAGQWKAGEKKTSYPRHNYCHARQGASSEMIRCSVVKQKTNTLSSVPLPLLTELSPRMYGAARPGKALALPDSHRRAPLMLRRGNLQTDTVVRAEQSLGIQKSGINGLTTGGGDELLHKLAASEKKAAELSQKLASMADAEKEARDMARLQIAKLQNKLTATGMERDRLLKMEENNKRQATDAMERMKVLMQENSILRQAEESRRLHEQQQKRLALTFEDRRNVGDSGIKPAQNQKGGE